MKNYRKSQTYTTKAKSPCPPPFSPSFFFLFLITEQLFTCKLDGRQPTNSGKSPTHSRHLPKWVSRLFFVIFYIFRNALKLKLSRSNVEFQSFPGSYIPDTRFKGQGRGLEGREGRKREKKKEGIWKREEGEGEWGSSTHYFRLKSCTVL